MEFLKKAAVVLILSLFVAAFVGCKEKGPAEKAGEKIDETMKKAGSELDKAGEKIGETVEEAGDKAKEAME